MRRWWLRRTLRFRLALWYALGGTVLLSLFSATVYFYVQRWVARPLDEQLRADLATVNKNLSFRPDGTAWWQGRRFASPRRASWDEPWFELWNADRTLVLRQWPFDERQIDRLPAAPTTGAETLSIYNIAPDLRLRVLAAPFPGPGGQPWMARTMRIHEPATEALHALLLIIVVALPIVISLLVLVGYTMTHRWLKPLDTMLEEATRITADDLSRRLPVVNASDELGRLATVFNVTLERLENSFVTLDRFVADASHELRTPLTTLRSVGEVGLRRSRNVEEYREIIGSMLEEAQRLQFLIQRLLELASAEGGAEPVHLQVIDLAEIATACANELTVLAEAKGQCVEIESGGCRVTTDPVIFRQALQNLLDNAIKYGPPASRIRVSVQTTATHGVVSVEDQGPGIDPALRERITDRFFRAGGARARSPEGFGLGLAITKAYMRTLGGTLDCAPAHPTGTVFRLRLPRS